VGAPRRPTSLSHVALPRAPPANSNTAADVAPSLPIEPCGEVLGVREELGAREEEITSKGSSGKIASGGGSIPRG
jgi:hypothetical protein